MTVTTTVPNNKFQNENGLTGISLPKATSIGIGAFQSSHLTHLSIPKATTIGIGAFQSSPLTHLSLPKATIIGQNAFYSIVNSPNTHVTLPPQFLTSKEKDKIFGKGPNGESH